MNRNPNSTITSKSRQNMTAKLDVAKRSLEKILLAKNDQLDLVQDSFLNLLQATHSIWFYFGRWVKDTHQTIKAKDLIEAWKSSNLDDGEKKIWEILSSLRNGDVHVEPVIPQKPEKPKLLVNMHGQLIVNPSGQLLTSKEKPFRVIQDGKEYGLLPLCTMGVGIYSKFVSSFESVAP